MNFVGHPMQGAVSGRLFLLNDPRYNKAEFGSSATYWKGKLRAAAFAWAFSEQFEIGPFSEASIGHIQGQFPQQGFVDDVVTPAVGLGWMVAEDVLDRYIVNWVEDRTQNRWLRRFLRTGLNPARSFANVVDGKAPWHRESRTGAADRAAIARESRTPAPFEFTAAAGLRDIGGKPCMGGGGEAAFRVAPEWQLVADVNGCKLLAQEANVSGDALVYRLGPRWTPSPGGKWSPYAHFLVGGMKVTHEELFPALKAQVLQANQKLDPSLDYTLHDQYTRQWDANGLAVTAGTGVDYALNAAVAIRVAGVEYLRSNLKPYNNGLQVTTGIVLRIGTW